MIEDHGNPGGLGERHLVDDSPSLEDAFGPHARIAAAISRTMCEDRGGRAIALIGSYGSGKSSVVEMLRALVAEAVDTDSLFFVFDAWSHEGDSLRRAFLEGLESAYEDKGWDVCPEIKDDLRALSRRVETSRAEPKSVLTPAGIWVAATVPVAAAGVALKESAWWLGFAPLLPALVAFLGWVFAKDRSKAGALFWNAPETIVEMATVKPAEPTSLEFARIFRKMMRYLGGPRRLIVVLDNLDRLEPQPALRLLSTMRTFFDPSATDQTLGDHIERKMWLLVPFDRKWLASVGASSGSGDGNAFLEKSFQTRVFVPDTVHGSWRAYLVGVLAEALPYDKKVFDDISYIYWLICGTNPARTTPRALKQFANRLVLADRMWQDVVPITTQAAYVALNADEEDATPKKILDGSLFAQDVVDAVADSSWKNNTAAMLYGLEPLEAMQVLLGPVIGDAVKAESPKSLAAYKDGKGFSEACQAALAENATSWANVQGLGGAAHVYAQVGALAFGRNPMRFRAWLERSSSWENKTRASGDGTVSILETYATDGEQQLHVNNIFLTRNPLTSDDSKKLADVRRIWFIGNAPIIRWAHRKWGNEFAQRLLLSRESADDFFALLLAARNDAALLPLVAPGVNDVEVIETIVRHLRDGNSSVDVSAVLGLLRSRGTEWPSNGLAIAVQDALELEGDWSGANVAAMVGVIVFLATESSAALEYLRAISTDGRLLDCLSNQVDRPALFGKLLYPYLVFGNGSIRSNGQPALQRIAEMNADLSNPGFELIRKALKETAYVTTSSRALLAKVCENGVSGPLTEFLLVGAIGEPEMGSILAQCFAESYEYLIANLSTESVSALLKSISVGHDLDKVLLGKEYDARYDKVAIARLNYTLEKCDPNFIQTLCHATLAIERESWISELGGEIDRLRLVRALVEYGQKGWLQEKLEDAIRSHAQSLSTGAPLAPDVKEYATHAILALQDDRARNICETIADLMPTGVLPRLVECYGEALLRSNVLQGRADGFARLPLLRALDDASNDQLQWVARVLRLPGFVGHISKGPAQALREHVLVLSGSEDDSARCECLKAIEDLLPIDPDLGRDDGDEQTE